jgi:uncharacterized protein YdbL (DUF1318 family)
MRRTILILAVLAMVGCAVVNVYVTFPEEKIEKAAEQLLAPPSQSKPQSNLQRLIFTGIAYADDAVEVSRDIKTDSPAIRAAKQKMDTWREEIDTYKRDGFVGETNEFTVVVRDLPSNAEKATRVKKLVNDENQQRNIMIQELLKINNAPAGEITKFKKIFADVMKSYSPSGTWVQEEEWRIKE